MNSCLSLPEKRHHDRCDGCDEKMLLIMPTRVVVRQLNHSGSSLRQIVAQELRQLPDADLGD
ncbi:MAG TPA: hypothetical protein PLE42_07210, partial [Candidatus Competibacteraceae bacterium]|nr:hypothetical protein [Candidatus Competibacteraceae bacterium]